MIKLSLNIFSIMIKDKIFLPKFYQFFIDYTCSTRDSLRNPAFKRIDLKVLYKQHLVYVVIFIFVDQ